MAEERRNRNAIKQIWRYPGRASVKNLPPNVGDIRNAGSIPGSRRCPGVRHGNPLKYSGLESTGQRSLAAYSP